MALPFFRALNPASEKSGITYSLAYPSRCQGEEMLDYTVSEQVLYAWDKKLDVFSALSAVFHILFGTHYDLPLNGRHNCKGGAKGALDYFIFPLVARKLIADSYLPERRETSVCNSFAWIIAAPLELIRFLSALSLTVALSPFVFFIHLIRSVEGLYPFSSDRTEADNTQPNVNQATNNIVVLNYYS